MFAETYILHELNAVRVEYIRILSEIFHGGGWGFSKVVATFNYVGGSFNLFTTHEIRELKWCVKLDILLFLIGSTELNINIGLSVYE